jgi:predicted RNA-binding Zn ribbon-like protein
MEDDVLPDAARLLRDFVNTREPQVDSELLTDAGRLGTWLTQHRLLPAGTPVSAADLGTAIRVREGLRGILLGHAGHAVDRASLESLNVTLTEVPVHLAFEADGGYRLRGSAPDSFGSALAGLLDAVREAEMEGSWLRLKVCARDSCRWAFYDGSRNQVRRWCSMAGCGNHVKMQRAYRNRKARQDTLG